MKVRIAEVRDPDTDPPPSNQNVLALVRHWSKRGTHYQRIRAMRLDEYALECDEDFGPANAWWHEGHGDWFFPPGWYETTAYPMNVPECEGPAAIPLEWECEVVAWMEMPLFQGDA